MKNRLRSDKPVFLHVSPSWELKERIHIKRSKVSITVVAITTVTVVQMT